MDRNILIVDVGNLAHRVLYGYIYSCLEDQEDFYLWRHIFVNSLFETVKKFSPDQVILALDSKNSWRYSIYPQYKANRKLQKEKTNIDFKRFYSVMESFIEDFKKIFANFVVLKIDRCEADDIIGVLCQKLDTDNITILSSDTDFIQLQVNSKIKQFDPIKNEYIKSINPKKELLIKILSGDKNDFIFGIKPRCGVKTAEKIITNDTLEEELKNEEVKLIFERNSKLIDLKNIPEDIKELIWNTYENYELSFIEFENLLKFWYENNLIDLMERWGYEYREQIARVG